jgi:hypothetical protein
VRVAAADGDVFAGSDTECCLSSRYPREATNDDPMFGAEGMPLHAAPPGGAVNLPGDLAACLWDSTAIWGRCLAITCMLPAAGSAAVFRPRPDVRLR